MMEGPLAFKFEPRMMRWFLDDEVFEPLFDLTEPFSESTESSALTLLGESVSFRPLMLKRASSSATKKRKLERDTRDHKLSVSCDNAMEIVPSPRNIQPSDKVRSSPIVNKPSRAKRQRKRPPPKDRVYVQVRENDVRFGQGNAATNHPGNIQWRADAIQWKVEIKAQAVRSDLSSVASKQLRGRMVSKRKHDLVQTVKNRKGRFLEEEIIRFKAEDREKFVAKGIQPGGTFDYFHDGKYRRAKYAKTGRSHFLSFGFYETHPENALAKASQALREPWKNGNS